MIVEVYAETQNLADSRAVGWITVLGNIRGQQESLCTSRSWAMRVGPWIRQDPEIINP